MTIDVQIPEKVTKEKIQEMNESVLQSVKEFLNSKNNKCLFMVEYQEEIDDKLKKRKQEKVSFFNDRCGISKIMPSFISCLAKAEKEAEKVIKNQEREDDE